MEPWKVWKAPEGRGKTPSVWIAAARQEVTNLSEGARCTEDRSNR